jgi:hypothetical protein
MGKTRRLISLTHRREFFLQLGATFVAILGIASAVLTILGSHFGVWGATLLALGALAISCLLHMRKVIPPQVPIDDMLAPEVNTGPIATIHCPCSSGLTAEAKLGEPLLCHAAPARNASSILLCNVSGVLITMYPFFMKCSTAPSITTPENDMIIPGYAHLGSSSRLPNNQ